MGAPRWNCLSVWEHHAQAGTGSPIQLEETAAAGAFKFQVAAAASEPAPSRGCRQPLNGWRTRKWSRILRLKLLEPD
eukprot:2773034-Rhodomonas_salina.1